MRDLTQPSDFATKETITIKADNSKTINNVRIIGPFREKTQVEFSITDAVTLGINPPIRISGDLNGSLGIVLEGPNGEVKLEEGVIISKRHLHCATIEAKKLKLKNGQIVSIITGGDREVIFNNIIVRVGDNYRLCLHLDTDEGNAAGINKVGEGIIL
jgi:putative phosphotransacetylase